MKKNIVFFTKALMVLGSLSFMGVNISNPAPDLFVSLPNNTVGGIIMFILKLLLGIVGTLSVLFIIIGGFQYISSAGNEELATAGKKTLTNAIIGLVIVILSYVIVRVIVNAFYTGTAMPQ